MPRKIFDLITTPLNTCNDTSPSGFTDVRTGYPVNAGGLNLGDFVELTDAEAGSLSGTNNLPVLRGGTYRRVQVSSGATASNVKTGTVALLAPGGSVLRVNITTAGSGQTAGTYVVSANTGTATITVIVGSGGTVTAQPIVSNPGSGYTSVPTFTLSAGGTAATFTAELAQSTYVVSSYDVGTAGTTRGIFLNSITPGNYGWIQEVGQAYVLGKSTFTGTAATGVFVNSTTLGVVDVPTATTAFVNTTVGVALDVPQAGQLFKINLFFQPWQA